MNKKQHAAAVCCLFVIFGVAGAQIQSGSATTPVSGAGMSPITPPSSYQRTLVPSRPDLTGRDQNLVITGNVPGGRHFQGPVPYGPVSALGAGSDIAAPSPVDSFIRRSAGLPYADRNPGAIQPFYQPRTTVGSLQRQGMLGLTPPGTSVQATGARAISSLPLSTSPIYRPRSMLSMSAAELERLSGIDMLTNATHVPTDSFLQDSLTVEPPGRVSEGPVLRPNEIRETKVERGLLDLPASELTRMQTPAPSEPEVPLSNEARELKALIERDLAAYDRTRNTTDVRAQEKDVWPAKPQERLQPTPGDDEMKPDQTTGVPPASGTDRRSVESRESKPAEGLPPLATDQREAAHRMLGKYAGYKELAAAKVKEFTDAADALMKQGKYYKAIDTYVLGLIWDRRDARLNLHRAIAHFGAGEFVSAALFLERAILLEPAYASDDAGLADLLPSKDVVDNQLIEGAEWQKQTGSGEIAMLLAWAYGQQGQKTRAAEYMKLAQEKIPANAAAATLAKALGDQ